MDDIYLDRPNLYIGFHGCEVYVRNKKCIKGFFLPRY